MGMYFPYFRGKQYELIAIRESAELLALSGFVPIIEPVKESFNSLFFEDLQEHRTISVGVSLREDVALQDAVNLVEAHEGRKITFVHAGFSQGRELAERLSQHEGDFRHVFIDEHCGKLYQRHFRTAERILLRDGFQRRTNREYPSTEFFSDLHITYEDENVGGFGDFLIVGDDYSESGGPAYAVAIHLTYIDSQRDDEMHVHHFVSNRQDTPTDPAGKFGEALAKLVTEVNRPGTEVEKTEAVESFIELSARAHYPGLGSVKKLSMLHHIQTLANYFSDR